MHAAGALQACFAFITNGGALLLVIVYYPCFVCKFWLRYRDAVVSAMSVISRCCSRLDPTDDALPLCVERLSELLQSTDVAVRQHALQCFSAITDRFARKKVDPAPLAAFGSVSCFMSMAYFLKANI